MESITSVKNPTVRALRALRDRRGREEQGRILVEGEVMIREALKCGLTAFDLIAEARCEAFAREMEARGVRTYLVPDSVIGAACETRTPQGVCASFSMPQPTNEEAMPDVLVALDGVQDPGNVGTIWRTADAAGFQGLIFGEGSADPMSPKVLRATMGSGFRLPYCASGALAETLRMLGERGYSVIVSDLSGEDFYARRNPGHKLALVIGNEARGVSDAVRACANLRLKLPMRGGAESLNAAIAAAIMMYDLMREYEK